MLWPAAMILSIWEDLSWKIHFLNELKLIFNIFFWSAGESEWHEDNLNHVLGTGLLKASPSLWVVIQTS